MQSISSIIPEAVKRSGISKKVVSSQTVSLFERVKDDYLDNGLARKVQAVYFDKETLNIASLSTLATQDLTIKTDDIIERLNNTIGQDIVKKINIII